MKKSIFKRIVSAALALTMLASMAVGMSTSVSAATNAVPDRVYFKVENATQRRYNEDLDFMVDPDISSRCSDITLKWNRVNNAQWYRIRVIWKPEADKESFTFKDYLLNVDDFNSVTGETRYYRDGYSIKRTVIEDDYSCKLTGLPFLIKSNFDCAVYDISLMAINAAGVGGPSTSLYDLAPGAFDSKSIYLSRHIPCMSKASGYSYKKLSDSKAKITIKDNAVMSNYSSYYPDYKSLAHPIQGYRLTFTDKKTNKQCFGFAYNSSEKTCTVRNLEPGHTYKVTCQTFVTGYAGESIYMRYPVALKDYTHAK